MCELSPVPFHGDTIFCIDYHGEPFTPMKPIVENMGLAWQTQARKLSDNKERWGITMMVIPTESGEQEMVAMPVRKLPAFLAGINPKKVRPELRPKIELYQNESDNALWDYWTKGRAEREAVADRHELPPADAPITPDQQCTLQAIVKAKIEALPESERRNKGLYPQIWSRFNNHFRLAQYRQLPQCRLSEAVEYLTQLDLAPAPKALPGPAMPRVRVVAHSCNKELRAAADIAAAIRLVEDIRRRVQRDHRPGGCRIGDRRGQSRYEMQWDMFRACNASLGAAVAALCAAVEVGDWA